MTQKFLSAVGRIALFVLTIMLFTGCSAKGESGLLLHLSFDEGTGTEIQDSAGKAGTATVEYQFTHAAYMDSRDPEWRTEGVSGGCLLFDGCSNYISYDPDTVLVEGQTFAVSVWVAPRCFEWDDPNAAPGNEHLTAVVGQYNKNKKQGFLLGYQRFGKLCFQVGTGEDWICVWSGDKTLNKYAWNHVAAVFNGKDGSISLYLNGEVVGTQSVAPGSTIAPAGKGKLLVGKNAYAESIAAGTFNMFSGLMDELKLYSRLPSAEELTPEPAPEIAYGDIALQNILTGDPFKTQFHGGPYEHWMNEPHAPVYYNGMYHLFFQQNIVGTYWRNICWGHLVSEDLVNWRPMKEAITPMENTVVPDGVWSGGAALDVNGVPLLFFTAGNDSFAREGMISNQNIGVAYPADLSDPELTDWVVCDKLAIQQQAGQGRPGEFRDPHIWREGDTWFMLICSGSTRTTGGCALLFETKTLELLPDGSVDMDWVYRGPVYEMEDPAITYGTSWELPILLPLTNSAGTVTRHAFFFSPAPANIGDNKIYYFLGDFDPESGKFTPDEAFHGEPALLDYGSNVFTGPSAFQDPVSGNTYLFSIMQDQRSSAEEGAAGWAHCVGLTRRIWLNDQGTDLKMEPIEALRTLEGAPLIDSSDLTLAQANEALKSVSEDLLCLRMTVDVADADKFSIVLKSDGDRDATIFSYQAEDGSISAVTHDRGKTASTGYVSGALPLDDGLLHIEIYVDRSLVEAFFNDTKSISVRSYSDFDSRGIFLEADASVLIRDLYAAPMGSIY